MSAQISCDFELGIVTFANEVELLKNERKLQRFGIMPADYNIFTVTSMSSCIVQHVCVVFVL